MCAATIMAWLPYSVMSLLLVYGLRRLISPQFSAIAALFAKASTICSPCLYCLANRHFRKAMLESVPCLQVLSSWVLCYPRPQQQNAMPQLPTPAWFQGGRPLSVVPENGSKVLSGNEVCTSGGEDREARAEVANTYSCTVIQIQQNGKKISVNQKTVQNTWMVAQSTIQTSPGPVRGTDITFLPREPTVLDISEATVQL